MGVIGGRLQIAHSFSDIFVCVFTSSILHPIKLLSDLYASAAASLFALFRWLSSVVVSSR